MVLKPSRIIGNRRYYCKKKHGLRLRAYCSYHLPVLDADLYATISLVLPILRVALRDILLPDGTLNRQKLGQIIFSSQDERRWLEQQIHLMARSLY